MMKEATQTLQKTKLRQCPLCFYLNSTRSSTVGTMGGACALLLQPEEWELWFTSTHMEQVPSRPLTTVSVNARLLLQEIESKGA